ncbi:26S proteasome non-ATPase regulatory subunit 13-like A [Vitis vinifera]|uniref:26S proteasome non-ATPase regulatory subunit 13-like A n=1 Tax=Vitis vinifera TaxID=29760 RepID=A0A438H7L7_VITVI|nr:26S proteasome non-ATPase regulatory subunit 13-like A [Vitis vinifera]
MAALQYLESLRAAHPELAEWYNSLADLYQRKLWHQLTLKLEQFVALAVFQACSPIFLHFLSLILFFLSSGDLEGDGGFWDLRSITTWGIRGQGSSSSEAQQGHSLLACFCSFEAQGAPRRKVVLEPEAQGASKARALVK